MSTTSIATTPGHATHLTLADGSTITGQPTAQGALVFAATNCLEQTRWPSGATLVRCTLPAGHAPDHRHGPYTWTTNDPFAS